MDPLADKAVQKYNKSRFIETGLVAHIGTRISGSSNIISKSMSMKMSMSIITSISISADHVARRLAVPATHPSINSRVTHSDGMAVQ